MAKGDKRESRKNLVSRREFLLGGGAIIATVALAACTPKTTTLTTSTGTSTLTPKYGGVLKVISNFTSPTNLGWPAEVAGGGAFSQFCLETLLRGDNKANLYPWLAETYRVADDLKSITFNLRKGVKFHDGSDFNAKVAKWNLENFIDAKTEPYWASVDIIDDYTIRVNFTEWANTLPASFADADPSVFMVSKTAFDKNGVDWMRSNPVGTGPFKFESSTLDVSMKVVRNPDYWVKGKPYLDGVEAMFVVDPATRKMLMQTGKGDMADASPGKDAADYAAMGLTIKTVMDANNILVPDSAHADSIWANQKVRQAVEYAINREAIAKAFGYGYLQAPYQMPSRNSLAYDPNYSLARKYDPDKAKQLLAEGGYSDGFKTTILVCPGVDRNVTIALQADLAKVGIEVNLEYPEGGKWVTYMGPGGSWHNAAITMPCPAHDPTFIGGLKFAFTMWGDNWLKTPELIHAYQAALSSPTPDTKLVRAVTDMITRDALFIPVYEQGLGRAQQPYVVAGYDERITTTFWNTEDVWLNK